jgi:hypothetical protein
MRNSFSSTNGLVVVGGVDGFDVDGAMNISVVLDDDDCCVELGASTRELGGGDAVPV